MDFTGNFTHNTCHEESNRKNRSRKSNDCNEFKKSCRQGTNCATMCEREKVGNTKNCNEKSICEHKDCDSCYDNCGNENDVAVFDVNSSNEPCGQCKSGINVNVVLHQDTTTNQNCAAEPKYNVSFKHCCEENNQKCEQKRRKRSNPITLTSSFLNLSKTKKHKKPETNRTGALVQQKAEGSDENGSNFRCTFENCCGNCESYIMEIPRNDMSTYQNWQNMEFEAGNTCFDECCCPREMKMYSSNLSLTNAPRHEQCCVTYTENEKCCSHPIETKCTFLPNDRKESSKYCLQRVHFAKAENCTRPNHSSCSFCSRKCTPSKASLFVEISESIADVCNLRTAQVFQICRDSKESLKSDQGQKEHPPKRKISDLLRGRCKSKKHADTAKCNGNCKSQPATVTRCYSDRVACMEKYDNCTIEDGAKRSSYGQTRNAKSSVSFQESRDCRAQTESNMYINKKTANCNQQCEAINRSLWEDIRKAKIWSQVQDTCKSLVKLASTSIGQIMKQSTKLKKKYTKYRSKEKCIPRTDQCPASVTANECWNETMIESKTCDASYCGNMCCSLNQISEIVGLQQCQMPMCQTCRLCQNEQEATSSDRSSCFSTDDIQGNSYSFNEGRLNGQLLPTCGIVRERGGSDGRRTSNQKKKPMNSNRHPLQNGREQPGTSNNRRNSRNQATRRRLGGNPEDSPEYDFQSDHATICIDMNLDSSTIRAVIEPVDCPYVMESMSYQKRVRAVRRMDRYPDAVMDQPRERYLQPAKREAPMIEEADYTAPPVRTFKEEMKKPRRASVSATRKTEAKSPMGKTAPKATTTGRISKSETNNKKPPPPKKDAYKAAPKVPDKRPPPGAKSPRSSKEIQCEIIQANLTICGDREMADVTGQVQQLCSCTPIAGAPLSLEVAEEYAADVEEDAVEETVQEVDIADVKQEIISVETETTVMDESASVQTESVHEETEESADTEEEAPEETESTSMEETEVSEDKEPTPIIEEEPEEEGAPAEDEEVTPVEDEEVIPVEEDEEETEDQEDKAMKSTQVEEAEKQAVEVDRTSAEESEPVTAITPVADGAVAQSATDPGDGPMEFYREFRTRRNYVSVEMQTSSTILTKILSEFQVGNKKRQILMNIKLQTSMNASNEEEQQQHRQLESNDTSVTDSKDQTPTDEDMQNYYREQKRMSADKAMQLGPRNLTGALNGTEGNDRPVQGSKSNLCSGPCGRKKYP